MIRRNACLEAAVSVLVEHGLAYTVVRGGKHLLLRYAINGRQCCTVVSKTGSDLRGPMNSRSQVRRTIRGVEAGR